MSDTTTKIERNVCLLLYKCINDYNALFSPLLENYFSVITNDFANNVHINMNYELSSKDVDKILYILTVCWYKWIDTKNKNQDFNIFSTH